MSQSPREVLHALYRAALSAVEGRACVAQHLREHLPDGPVHLVAVGKAAAAMTRGALDVLDGAVAAGLVVTREGYADPELDRDERLRQLQSAHPVPDGRSLEAGEALVSFLSEAPADTRFLFLISGGASSLVELLPEGVGAEQLAELNRRLLAGGYDIHARNRARKAFSRIKGGRLARWLDDRPTTALLISDVHGDDPSVIGSGLLFADPAGPPGPAGAPPEIRELCPPAEPAPAVGDPALGCVAAEVIATNTHALDAAAAEARRLGLPVHRTDVFVDGEAAGAGAGLARALLEGPPGVHLWGGEPTVTLPERPGRGGRMQTLALAAATVFRRRTDALLLAAGTDGADGPTEDAGAVVDGDTVARGEAAGLSARGCLDRADAGTFLAASGDLLRTGGTGTNVMDVMIGLKTGDPVADA